MNDTTTTNRRRTNSGPAKNRRVAKVRMVIQNIVVPLDFSGFARQALTCAVPLACRFKARIHLVHVAQSPVVMQSFPDGGIALPVNTDHLVALAQRQLEDMAARFLPAAVRAQTVVRQGSAAFEVVSAANTLEADLIVLSTTGRSGLSRAFLGSTAERIVRHAHCPVLTVRRGAGAARMLSGEKPNYPERLPWRRILVPLDLSFTSLRALDTAAALAQHSHAGLFLLNVVEPSPYPTGMEGAVLAIPDQKLAENAKEQLPRLAERFVPKPVRVTSLVARGRAASVIVETAAAKGVDLIVLSTHGHTGLDRLLMGSTAEQVVRHAQCPVYVVRKPQSF